MQADINQRALRSNKQMLKERRKIMFPNNPLYVEKLVYTKQEDILRQLPNQPVDAFRDLDQLPIQSKARRTIWIPVSLLIALAWLFSELT